MGASAEVADPLESLGCCMLLRELRSAAGRVR